MAFLKPLFLTIPALTLGWVQPVLALTAEELWAEWQSQSAAMGQMVSVQEQIPGDGSLTLNGYAMRYTDAEVSTMVRLDQVVFNETGDGRVIITMSDTYDLTISLDLGNGGQPVDLNFAMIAPDLRVIASGTPAARVYDYTASRLMFEDRPITGGNAPLPVIDVMIAVADLTARYEIDGTNPTDLRYTSNAAISGLSGALDITPPPGEEGSMKISFALGASTSANAGQLTNFANLATKPGAFPENFANSGVLAYDSARLEMTFSHPRDGFTLLASNQGGRLSADISRDAVDFALSATVASTYLAARELPVPVAFTVGGAELAFRMPLAPTDGPQPIALRLAYRDLAPSPEIWALVDPGQAIPRDPITAIVDLSGTARILRDLFALDPAGMGDIPGQLVDLGINELRITAAGAELTGSGRADFPPGPIPMPVGAVDLQLRGLNALFDRLQAAGLVPIEQLAMARGLLGAFARPGADPDTLETRLEFTQGGGISANGVPLR
ncbi:DUF2125 domain-containing protein [Roseicyclus sp.]|uniref:DUF2125 domain-containing protein n=1 Tax=Roseicyclus sp. TaxID=1914329 RepID=UPI003F6AEA02